MAFFNTGINGKYIHLLLVCSFAFNPVFSQKNKSGNISYYVFDAAWKPCKAEEAVYFASCEKLNDTAWQWKNYHFAGPLLSVETYKDEEASIPHGYFAWFDNNGIIDSSGETFEGKKHGSWLYFTDTLSVWQTEKYERGVLIERKDSIALRRERGEIESLQSYPDEKEAAFRGGNKGWLKYLQTNLKYPERAVNMGKTGKVLIYFIVDSNGNITDIKLHKSVEYSLDEEALRLIRQSPKWEPAFQNGKNVKAYRRQPVTFSF